MQKTDTPYLIGLISDTHGILHPGVFDVFRNVDAIIHAGDIGNTTIVAQLKSIAPLVAIRGNTDTDEWAKDLPETTVFEKLNHKLYVIHDLGKLDFDLKTSGFKAVIYGHTHQAKREEKDGVFYINSGSAAGIRSNVSTVGLLKVAEENIEVLFVEM